MGDADKAKRFCYPMMPLAEFEDEDGEVWKQMMLDRDCKLVPVPDYEVSNRGNVRRLHAGAKVRQLHPSRTHDGYLKTDVMFDGKQVTVRISRIVLLSFAGMPGEIEEADHRNKIRHDNRRENLQWKKRGINRSEAARSVKRTKEARLALYAEIDRRLDAGRSMQSIATELGVRDDTVRRRKRQREAERDAA